MTNKLKKEIEGFVGEMCEDGDLKVNSDDFYKFIKNIKKQAKLSQKQEDDERFEEFIKRLKTSLCLGDWDVAGKDDCVMCKTVDKIAEELNGENKK